MSKSSRTHLHLNWRWHTGTNNGPNKEGNILYGKKDIYMEKLFKSFKLKATMGDTCHF